MFLKLWILMEYAGWANRNTWPFVCPTMLKILLTGPCASPHVNACVFVSCHFSALMDCIKRECWVTGPQGRRQLKSLNLKQQDLSQVWREEKWPSEIAPSLWPNLSFLLCFDRCAPRGQRAALGQAGWGAQLSLHLILWNQTPQQHSLWLPCWDVFGKSVTWPQWGRD